jgi:hypothetical protein
MLLSVVLAAEGEPLSQEELQVAVAALEDQLGRLHVIEARFRVVSEYRPGYVPPKLPPGFEHGAGIPQSYFWIWKPPKELYSVAPGDDPEHILQKTIYDGATTYSWDYDRDDGRVRRVSIQHEPPSDDFRTTNELACVLGLRYGGLKRGCGRASGPREMRIPSAAPRAKPYGQFR